uniref:Adenylyl-sulfate kinase n=1 Tax=Caldimicrobium thiodismutans TaxID=1653476 RepID=A0A832GNH1_9BACT
MFKGLCLWLTGLPSSGKSTLALGLFKLLRGEGYRVKVYDGDEVRGTISADLGFSRKDREENQWRVARLVKRDLEEGYVVICALVSPYREIREQIRDFIGAESFCEIFVDAPLEVCKGRDSKGLYARAIAGELSNFTGLSDPYEPPLSPDLHIRTDKYTVEESLTMLKDFVLRKLRALYGRGKKVLLVLGMHRSGTSLLAGLLHLSGIGMGRKLLPPAFDNPKGFFENQAVYKLNEEELLPLLGTKWYDPIPLEREMFAGLPERLRQGALKILEEEYEGREVFGIKDPRLAILFPFWEEVLREFGAEIGVVFIHRNPLEVAYSLHYRDNFPIERGLLLWVKYNLCGELFSRAYPRIFVSYKEVLTEPVRVLKRIFEFFSLGRLSPEAERAVLHFTERRLKHFNFSLEDLKTYLRRFYPDLDFVAEIAECIERLSIEGMHHQGKEIDELLARLGEAYRKFRERINEVVHP